MLYISRKASHSGYCLYVVVDSEDGVETHCNLSELETCCIQLGLDIKGVVVQDGEVKRVEIYNIDTNALRVKTHVMYGVDISVVDGTIAQISIANSKASGDVIIRLSDYARCFLLNTPIIDNRWPVSNKITFVLDDKLSVSGSVCSFAGLELHWDIREVSNKETLKLLYKSVVDKVDFESYDNILVDRPERARFLSCAGFVSQATSSIDDFARNMMNWEDYSDLSGYVAEFYRNYFEAILKTTQGGNIFRGIKSSRFVETMKSSYHMWQALDSCEEYTELIESLQDIAWTLRWCGLGSKTVGRFKNYFRYFEAPDWLRDMYVDICRNIIESAKAFLGMR